MVPSLHYLLIHFQYQSLGQNCTFKVIVSRKTGTEVKMFEGMCGDTFVIETVLGSFNAAYTFNNCPDWDGDVAPDCCVSNGWGDGINAIKNQNGKLIAFTDCDAETNIILSQAEANSNVLGQNCTFEVNVSGKDGNNIKLVEGRCGDTFWIDNVLGSYNDAYKDNCPDWAGDVVPDCCKSHRYGTGANAIKNQNGKLIAFTNCNAVTNIILSQAEVSCNCVRRKGMFASKN